MAPARLRLTLKQSTLYNKWQDKQQLRLHRPKTGEKPFDTRELSRYECVLSLSLSRVLALHNSTCHATIAMNANTHTARPTNQPTDPHLPLTHIQQQSRARRRRPPRVVGEEPQLGPLPARGALQARDQVPGGPPQAVLQVRPRERPPRVGRAGGRRRRRGRGPLLRLAAPRLRAGACSYLLVGVSGVGGGAYVGPSGLTLAIYPSYHRRRTSPCPGP